MSTMLPGARLLLLIRDGNREGKVKFESLCSNLGLDPYYQGMYLRAALADLERVGLVTHDADGQLQVTDAWSDIQTALNISLRAVAALSNQSLVVEPFFGHPDRLATPPDIFVMMPFEPALTPIWTDHIKRISSELGLKSMRADDFFTSHAVMADIWNAIYNARLLIGDCTGRNPNVFYEIGVAHAIGQKVILVTQNADDVPFDLRHLRYIQYDYTPPGMRSFEAKLAETIRQALELA